MSLLSLPNELLDQAVLELDDPHDLISFSTTCRATRLVLPRDRLTDLILPRLIDLPHYYNDGNAEICWPGDDDSNLQLEYRPSRMLYSAIKNGWTRLTTIAIGKGAPVNPPISFGPRAIGWYCPLYWAAKHGGPNVVRLLLEKGADPNRYSIRGYTISSPLHAVMKRTQQDIRDSLETAILMLDYGAKLELENDFSQTPLCIAIKRQRWELALLLLSRGANVHLAPYRTPLVFDALWCVPVLEAVIGAGADVGWRGEGGNTALHACIPGGYVFHPQKTLDQAAIGSMRLLLKHGADVMATNDAGETPLHLAAAVGSRDAVILLLEKGADARAFDGQERSVIDRAHQSVMDLLG
jgi:ankyrin repeat protein